jgi:hypothetical protein
VVEKLCLSKSSRQGQGTPGNSMRQCGVTIQPIATGEHPAQARYRAGKSAVALSILHLAARIVNKKVRKSTNRAAFSQSLDSPINW